MTASPEKGDLVTPEPSSIEATTESSIQASRDPDSSHNEFCTSHTPFDIISESFVAGLTLPRLSRDPESSRDQFSLSQSYDIISNSMVVVGSFKPTNINVRTDDREPENKPVSEVSTLQHSPTPSDGEGDVVLTGREQYESEYPPTTASEDESSGKSTCMHLYNYCHGLILTLFLSLELYTLTFVLAEDSYAYVYAVECSHFGRLHFVVVCI